MNNLEQFGIGADQRSALSHSDTRYPAEVPERTAHIDGDFLAYQVSAESKAELDPDDPTPRKTLEDMWHNAAEAVDHLRKLAGAPRAVVHVTHNSDKGGRDQQAILKRYQANRLLRENRPEQLDIIREYLGEGCNGRFRGVIHTDQEADDGMAQASYEDPVNNIVVSADKDLLMVPGLHLNPNSTRPVITKTDPFGWITLDKTPSGSAKPGGRGTKFFWWQVLMGDAADNISGLPVVAGKVWQTVKPTKAHTEALAAWRACSADEIEAKEVLEARLEKLEAPTKKVGPALSYEMISGCKSDKECWAVVKEAYVTSGHTFVHWDTGVEVTPTQALLSEMQLLWMRRSKDPMDVLKWLKEVTK